MNLDTPVTYGGLKAVVESIMDCISDASKFHNGVENEIVNVLIKQLKYYHDRDLYFFISMMSALHGVPIETLHEQHIKYCEEFDKLNKKE